MTIRQRTLPGLIGLCSLITNVFGTIAQMATQVLPGASGLRIVQVSIFFTDSNDLIVSDGFLIC